MSVITNTIKIYVTDAFENITMFLDLKINMNKNVDKKTIKLLAKVCW